MGYRVRMKPEVPTQQPDPTFERGWDTRKKKIVTTWVAHGMQFFLERSEKENETTYDTSLKKAEALFNNTGKMLKLLLPKEDHERPQF